MQFVFHRLDCCVEYDQAGAQNFSKHDLNDDYLIAEHNQESEEQSTQTEIARIGQSLALVDIHVLINGIIPASECWPWQYTSVLCQMVGNPDWECAQGGKDDDC